MSIAALNKSSRIRGHEQARGRPRPMIFPTILAVLILALMAPTSPDCRAAETPAAAKPNIVWLTCEDMGPHLPCYGNPLADTPFIDRLAARSLRYRHAWSCAPVCAPARTTLISGLYPTSTGSEHMRSLTRLPSGFQMYPQYLRAAGYYCTNNSKEDYNLTKVGKVWDESSAKAHWRHRAPGQPFFAVFNVTSTHESQIRRRPHAAKLDPEKVPLPPYHPDVPEARRDWAQYYDNITTMDHQHAKYFRELEQAGLLDDTIILFYSDHGSGMPRNKRTPLNCGLHVPLLVYIPERFKHLRPADYQAGGVTDRLVSFVDFAPTVLSLAGIQPPPHLQGKAFLGTHQAPPNQYLHGFRGRMDERLDMVRSVRDARYVYARNYMPHKIYGQHVAYMFETPTTVAWRKLFDAGQLSKQQAFFWNTKPAEELYDLESDPHEIHNLASSSEHTAILERFRRAQREQVLAVRDVGFLPEEEIHQRAGKDSPYEMARDASRYPLEKILDTAEAAAMLEPSALPTLRAALEASDGAVRYWGALGIRMRGGDAVKSSLPRLRRCLADQLPSVQIAAAEALGSYSDSDDLSAALKVLEQRMIVKKNGFATAIQALNALDALGEKALPLKEKIRAAVGQGEKLDQRISGMPNRVVEHLLARLEAAK